MSPLKTEPDLCSHCGEQVTRYAVGCWLCGTKLDPLRWQRPPGLVQRALARWRAITSGTAD